jgi:hypothetical protein
MNDDSFDKMLREKVLEHESNYPAGFPTPDLLWKTFGERRRDRKEKRRKFTWRIAASIMIIMTAGYTSFLNKGTSELISTRAPSTKKQDAIDFINRYCSENNISCDKPVIQELQKDLALTFKKLEEIDQQVRIYGDDAELIRAKQRIVSHQATLIRTIVQTL